MAWSRVPLRETVTTEGTGARCSRLGGSEQVAPGRAAEQQLVLRVAGHDRGHRAHHAGVVERAEPARAAVEQRLLEADRRLPARPVAGRVQDGAPGGAELVAAAHRTRDLEPERLEVAGERPGVLAVLLGDAPAE